RSCFYFLSFTPCILFFAAISILITPSASSIYILSLHDALPICQSVFGSTFREGSVAVVDKQFVLAILTLEVAGVAYIDVDPSIAIDVGHGDAGAPVLGSCHASGFGNVFEAEIALVEKEPIGPHVSGKEYVVEAVVVDVADAYPTPVVVISEGEDIEVLLIFDAVDEVDTGLLRWEASEGVAGIVVVRGRATRTRHEQDEDRKYRSKRQYLGGLCSSVVQGINENVGSRVGGFLQ